MHSQQQSQQISVEHVLQQASRLLDPPFAGRVYPPRVSA